MKRPLSTKERIKTEIFRFFSHFSKIWRIRERYKVKRIGERADLWPTPMSTLNKEEEKLFQRYFVFLSTK